MKIYNYTIQRSFIKDIEDKKSSNSQTSFEIARNFIDFNCEQEQLIIIFFNTQHTCMGASLVHLGTINGAIVSQRDIFKRILLANASAIVLAHNHPSGLLQASQADIEMTRRVIKACELLDIEYMDHLIVTEEAFISIEV